MTASNDHQRLLIDPPPALYATRLESPDSPKRAFYEIAVYYLPGSGYLIKKSSGAQGAKPNEEMWFRPHLKTALEKKAHLIAAKLNTKRKGGRIYIEVAPLQLKVSPEE